MNERAETILAYWFGTADRPEPSSSDLKTCIGKWFESGVCLDTEIAERFSSDLDEAARGERDAWAETPRGLLALIVVLDQFSRNIRRGSPSAFELDARSLALTLRAIARGDEAKLNPVHRVVAYLPLMHSEDRAIQQLSAASYLRLYDDSPEPLREQMINVCRAAERHFDIIERFGRYPHRNRTLGREMTADEIAFLNQPNSSF